MWGEIIVVTFGALVAANGVWTMLRPERHYDEERATEFPRAFADAIHKAFPKPVMLKWIRIAGGLTSIAGIWIMTWPIVFR